MSIAIKKKLARLGGLEPAAWLETLVPLGRSSRRIAARHAALRRRDYESALAAEPEPSPERGRLLSLLGRRAEARRELSADLRRRPTGRAAAWLAEAGDARPGLLDRAVALEPGEPRWRLWRALASLAARGPARAALSDAEAAGEGAVAGAARAAALRRLGLPRRALRALDAALTAAPDEAWLYRLRGRLRLDAGDLEGFVSDACGELALDDALGTFSRALGDAPRYDPAAFERAATRFLARHRRAYWMRAFRGDCRRAPEVGDHPGGLRDLEEAASERPDSAWVLAYLSRARLFSGDEAGARAALWRAARLAPRCGWIAAWKAGLLLKLGDVSGALAGARRALVLDEGYELAHAWHGAALARLERWEAAERSLTVAVELSPGLSFAEKALAAARRALGVPA